MRSAGILLYRRRSGRIEVLLAHPGGPFWARRDDGAWTIPKGLIDAGETPEAAARREFFEELGAEATGTLAPLGSVRQRSGKHVEAFALEGDFDVAVLRSNTFENVTYGIRVEDDHATIEDTQFAGDDPAQQPTIAGRRSR